MCPTAAFQMFCVLNLSATLYPLIIRLRQRGLLNESIPNNSGLTLEKLIEITDVRVYKTRGTDPTRDVLNLSRKARGLTVSQIADELREFVLRFMDDTQFRAKLGQEIYGNLSVNRILTEYEKLVRSQFKDMGLTMDDLSKILRNEQTVEHVLPEEPDFGFPSYGFTDRTQYDLAIHRIGNLTLLEKRLNSRANNASVESKIRDRNLYHASDYRITRQIAADCASRNPVFSKSIIESRTQELSEFCMAQWPFWAAAT